MQALSHVTLRDTKDPLSNCRNIHHMCYTLPSFVTLCSQP